MIIKLTQILQILHMELMVWMKEKQRRKKKMKGKNLNFIYKNNFLLFSLQLNRKKCFVNYFFYSSTFSSIKRNH